ncbi:MAG TPA: NRDE family protein [Planctomycetaceae bacterium]|jgi:uncharacterized protein with NRDE domain|nr:NRDE family protein [Planctomycetaceae bacterium]
MCIFSVIYRVVPECPVFVLTNRDESTERPSRLPQIFTAGENGTRWFGGADAKAGGTWFGINEHGLLAAVTNRTKDLIPPNPRSRGLLCRDVLGHATPTSAVDWVLRELSQHAYAGFSLVIATAEAACVIEAADSTCVTQLGPGIHSISNGPLTAHDDRRVNLAQTLVTQMVDEEHDWRAYLRKSQQICAVHSSDAAPGMCVHRDHWGTVGSTIAALARDPKQSQYHYAPGPPCRTAYVDYSEAFRGMFASNR